MSAPLPNALRARFQRLIEEGLSGRAAALRLKLSPATGARWGLAIRCTGQARAAPQGRPRGKGKLDPHAAFSRRSSRRMATSRCLNWLCCFADATGVQAHPDAIGRFLRKLGYTYKKRHWSPPSAAGRVRKRREDWFRHRMPAVSAQPERVVFIDETSVKTNLTRLRGWSLRGSG